MNLRMADNINSVTSAENINANVFNYRILKRRKKKRNSLFLNSIYLYVDIHT